ncbi:MAG: histidinol dehydrogenase [Chloroflexi bacterium]|nr:MAG: histidinol dehydrogenase [Chloroflexota bacterium]
MPLHRFDAASWKASRLSVRRLDPSQFAKERVVVIDICARVLAGGDEALRELGRRFDGWAPPEGESFEVPPDDLASAIGRVASADRAALEFAAARIQEFHEAQLGPEPAGPAVLRLVTRPVRRAGVYAPGGRAVYPSTVLMTAIPARVAGVGEVALATPPRPDGTVPDAILAAAHIAGVDRVYRVGGAQAIAAFAYGTESIPRVDLIAGPGNEHDPLAWGVLFTDSGHLADRVEEELGSLLRGLERAAIIRQATCCIVVAESIDEAVALAEDFAPEHLLIVTEDAEQVAGGVRNAGAVFVGPYATVPLGDYTAGPNHTLPTSGAARFASPLGVHTFLKQTSVLTLNRDDLETLRDPTVRLAHLEGLGAHAHAVEVRLE